MAEEKNTGLTVYESNGEEIELSEEIVKGFLQEGNGTLTTKEIGLFIALCRYNHLNPFLKEAYLVKFNSKSGESKAQMIVAKEAYFKRAENEPTYEGIQAGVIVMKDNIVEELEGCFVPHGSTLVGGWAKVFRADRKFPIVAKVNIEEYDTHQSSWNTKKPTMIAKVAKVQALREAFPSKLGGLYIQEEQGDVLPLAEEVAIDQTKQGTKKVTPVSPEEIAEEFDV